MWKSIKKVTYPLSSRVGGFSGKYRVKNSRKPWNFGNRSSITVNKKLMEITIIILCNSNLTLVNLRISLNGASEASFVQSHKCITLGKRHIWRCHWLGVFYIKSSTAFIIILYMAKLTCTRQHNSICKWESYSYKFAAATN